MIEFRTLAYFVTACRSETLAIAARRMGIAPSTMTTALKGLEADLGVSLFHKINGSLYPTPAARSLLRTADPLVTSEHFARQWVGAAVKHPLRRLLVDLEFGFTIGGVSDALRRATVTLSRERADIFVDPVWSDDKDAPQRGPLAKGWDDVPTSRIEIALGTASRSAGLLHADRWVFACRLPKGTRALPSAAEFEAGHIVVPLLRPALIDQAERYVERHGIRSVRFLRDHPGDMPRLFHEHPDAVVFVPQTLVSPRLGLDEVGCVSPRHPLTTAIVARTPNPDSTTRLFLQHLKQALADRFADAIARPQITRRQIEYFMGINRLRRVSAAAHGVGLSQPALSEQLHKLETVIGARLFVRHEDGVVPTDAGERLARIAPVIAAGFDRLTSSSEVEHAPAGRLITLGVLPSVHQHGLLITRIAESLVDLQRRRPGLKIVVQEAPNTILQDWVTRGQVGIAIVETALPQMPRLPLGSSEALAVILHKRHELLPPGPVSLDALASIPFAVPTPRFGLRHLLDQAAEDRGLRLRPAMEIDSLPMIIALLDRLPMCTVLPPSAVRREIAAGDFVAHPIVEPVIARRLFAIHSGERALTAAERDLINELRKQLSAPDAV